MSDAEDHFAHSCSCRSSCLRKVISVSLLIINLACASAPPRVERWNDPSSHTCVSVWDARNVWLTRSSGDFAATNVWNGTGRASFSADLESGASLSRDRSSVLFTSRRTAPTFSDRWNIWIARGAHVEPLPHPVNSDHAECCAVYGPADEIYFSSTRGGSWDIYLARPNDAGFDVTRLGSEVNSGEAGPPDESGRNGEWPSFVDPEGRFLLFSSIRPGGIGGDDIYVSFRTSSGWTAAANLGPDVNTPGYEDCATVTLDGQHLIWSSRSTAQQVTSQVKTAPLYSSGREITVRRQLPKNRSAL